MRSSKANRLSTKSYSADEQTAEFLVASAVAEATCGGCCGFGLQ